MAFHQSILLLPCGTYHKHVLYDSSPCSIHLVIGVEAMAEEEAFLGEVGCVVTGVQETREETCQATPERVWERVAADSMELHSEME